MITANFEWHSIASSQDLLTEHRPFWLPHSQDWPHSTPSTGLLMKVHYLLSPAPLRLPQHYCLSPSTLLPSHHCLLPQHHCSSPSTLLPSTRLSPDMLLPPAPRSPSTTAALPTPQGVPQECPDSYAQTRRDCMCAHSHTTKNRLRSHLAHQKQLGVGHLTLVQSCRHAQECGAVLGWGVALH